MLPLPVDLACPPPSPDSPVTVEVVRAGYVAADWRMVVDSGARGPVEMAAWVGVIHHPAGVVLVDTGFGTATRRGEYPGAPFGGPRNVVPDGEAMVERLSAPPVKVLLTHRHYDHVSGLLDFPGVEAWSGLGDDLAYGPGTLGWSRALEEGPRWVIEDFAPGEAGRVLGRPAVDVLGDGTVWYLSTPGHTPGSTSVLVRAKDRAWLFVGDTAWVDAHLVDARRPGLVTAVIDAEPRRLRESLEWARWIHTSCPGVEVVAGHEPAPSR